MNAFTGTLGLALAGGGAHGAWQAGTLRFLSEGLNFDKVIGFSAGAMSGASYALGLQDVLEEKWRHVHKERVLRFAPKLKPFSLCSGGPVWESVRHTADESRRSAKYAAS